MYAYVIRSKRLTAEELTFRSESLLHFSSFLSRSDVANGESAIHMY